MLLLAELSPGLSDGLDHRFDVAPSPRATNPDWVPTSVAVPRYADVRCAMRDCEHTLRTAHATGPSGGECTLDGPEQVFELEAFGSYVHTDPKSEVGRTAWLSRPMFLSHGNVRRPARQPLREMLAVPIRKK